MATQVQINPAEAPTQVVEKKSKWMVKDAPVVVEKKKQQAQSEENSKENKQAPAPATTSSLGGAPSTKEILEKAIGTQVKYKTEMCRSMVQKGFCKYFDKCQFAHNEAELRPRIAHKKFKSELCRSYHTVGTCPYGERCRFIHDVEKDKTTAQSNIVLVDDEVVEAAAELVSEKSESMDDDSSVEQMLPEMVKAIQTLSIEKATRSGSSRSRSRASTTSSEDDSSHSGVHSWGFHAPPQRVSLEPGSASASASESAEGKVEIDAAELRELEQMCEMLSAVLYDRSDVASAASGVRQKVSAALAGASKKDEPQRIKLTPLSMRAAHTIPIDDESEDSEHSASGGNIW